MSNAGKADIVIDKEVRSNLETTIENHLKKLSQRINREFPDSLDDESLTEAKDKIMMSLLDDTSTGKFPWWTVPTFYRALCASIEDFNFTKIHGYCANPVTFAQGYFEKNFTPRRKSFYDIEAIDLKLKRVLNRLYDEVLSSKYDKEKIQKGLRAGVIEEDKKAPLDMRPVYKENLHVVFNETFIRELLDLYIPEAVKNFSTKLIRFHYSIYLFCNKKIPSKMDSVVYFFAKRAFEVAYQYDRLKGLANKEEVIEGFERLKGMLPHFIKTLRVFVLGKVWRADGTFPCGISWLPETRKKRLKNGMKK